jgi:hypothetical protein
VSQVSAWDLILAKQAGVLATCNGCRARPCAGCFWQGAFAAHIVELRRRTNQETWTCWNRPQGMT